MKTKKLLCMLLAAVMLLSLCGMAALASGEDLVIANAEEWSAFCDALENGTDYEGCTVTLTTDIVTDKMAGSSVRSGANLTADAKAFKGTFNGGGNTITFNYTTAAAGADQSGLGIFSALDGATVQNLKANVTITDTYGNYAVGGIAGYMLNGAVVDDCHVTGTISSVEDAGGIVGKGMSAANIKNSSNAADITTTKGKTGGIASSLYYTPAETGAMLIENCTNSGSITATAGGYTGGILGFGTGAWVLDCTNSGAVTGAATGIGGIVGELDYCGIVDGCLNTGAVVKNGNGYGAGGVVGWIRYPNSSTYASIGSDIAVVNNCVNKGSVTSDGGHTGGVIGVVYNAIKLTDCENYGVVTATGMSGLIVGNYQKTETTNNGVADSVTVTGCVNWAQEATLSGSSIGIVFGHIPEDPTSNTDIYTIADNQSVVVTNTVTNTTTWGSSYGNTVGLTYVMVGEGGVIRFAPVDNVISVYLAAEDEEVIQNFVAAEMTVEITGSFAVESFAPANDGLVIEDMGEGCYLIREKEAADGATDLSGSSILLGTITLNGYGDGTIGLKEGAKAQVQTRTVSDNIVITGNLTAEPAAFTITVPKNTLTVNVTFPNNITDNAAAYQNMKAVISGGDLENDIVVNFGSDADGATLFENAYSFTKELTENTTYTVTISGAGYRTTRYSVNMAEDKTLTFWNNVMDEAQVIETGKETSAVKSNFLAGDIVGDNNINIYDLSAVVSYFGTEIEDRTIASDYAKYDLNRDGVIDSKDVALVLVSWDN